MKTSVQDQPVTVRVPITLYNAADPPQLREYSFRSSEVTSPFLRREVFGYYHCDVLKTPSLQLDVYENWRHIGEVCTYAELSKHLIAITVTPKSARETRAQGTSRRDECEFHRCGEGAYRCATGDR
jgi:hypothetical protein